MSKPLTNQEAAHTRDTILLRLRDAADYVERTDYPCAQLALDDCIEMIGELDRYHQDMRNASHD